MKREYESKKEEQASSRFVPLDAGMKREHEAEKEQASSRFVPSDAGVKREHEAEKEEQASSRFVPSEAWIEAFHNQYSGALTQLIGRYAGRRASGNRKDGADVRYSRELVFDALTDTQMGKARWDPDAGGLKEHLRAVIKRRTYADWARAQRFPQQSFDVVNDEAERALRERASDPRAAENAADALTELCQCAADDPEVLAMIAAKAHGAESRAEVMHLTGFSEPQYRAVRRRLNHIVAQLPIQTRPKRNKGE